MRGIGHVRIAFAPAVAGRLHAHQAGVQRVLDVAAQDAVLDQHVALAGVAFVVDVERAAAVGDGAVVQHRDALGRHALADLAAENALEPLRLKSPSRPWPMASCSRMPGQPGPSTTVISPAGAGRASRLVSAALTASST
jgi:hypothetical protein